MISIAFIKEQRLVLLPLRQAFSTSPASSSNAQGSIASHLPIMSRSSLQGRWVASSVTKEDIAKLWEARYLTAEILHRLPAQGQVIPTPRSNERVVFISHFLLGLGFALHPFVRGLMFYYGLDFHNLAPDSFLHVWAFIIMCEAFLRIPPHFSLWLKTINVKPKVVDGK